MQLCCETGAGATAVHAITILPAYLLVLEVCTAAVLMNVLHCTLLASDGVVTSTSDKLQDDHLRHLASTADLNECCPMVKVFMSP